jgi:drug/metabolite transporter (DMT)-like permease
MTGRAGHLQGQTAGGIAYMLAGVICMVGLDASAKWLLADYSLYQLIFLRCSFSLLFIFWYGLTQDGMRAFATSRAGWHVVRSVLSAGSMFAFFHAIRFIPLADVMTLAFVAPLIVTALSRPFLGESVGPWRWGAVVVGFVGVLIVLQPGGDMLHPSAFIALAGAALYALVSLTGRKLSRTETTLSLSFWMFWLPWLLGAVGSVSAWVPPDPLDWALFALCGFFGGLAFVFMNAAFRRAPAAVIVPFEYTGLIWAALIGFLIWDEVPGRSTWLGAAVIIASGIFILYRETLANRSSLQANFPLQEACVVESDER